MVFISYSSKEYDEAFEVKKIIEANGINCWMAPQSIPTGSDYGVEIPKAIRECAVFVLVLSKNAQDSEWVPKELDCAITYKKIIVPFHMDNSDLKDAFNFRLSNVQRIEAYNRLSEGYRELILSLRRILNMSMEEAIILNQGRQMIGELGKESNIEETAASLTFWMSSSDGFIIFHSHEKVSEEESVFYQFTEEKWQMFSELLKKAIALIYGIETEYVRVCLTKNLGKFECAPVNVTWGLDAKYRCTFSINYFKSEEQNIFDSAHFEMNNQEFSLCLYKKGDYIFHTITEDTRLSDIGIDEELLVDVCKKMVQVSYSTEDVMIEKKFKSQVYEDKSGSYKLKFLVN